MSKLYKTCIHTLRRIEFEKIYFYSDSTIVLNCINTSPHVLKTFIANRMSEIRSITASYEWRHIISEQNPADLVSRGISVNELINNNMWFTGPYWLSKCESEWPSSEIKTVDVPEKRPMFIGVAKTLKAFLNLFDKFSSLKKLVRVVAYCQRFILTRLKTQTHSGELSVEELKAANELYFEIGTTRNIHR